MLNLNNFYKPLTHFKVFGKLNIFETKIDILKNRIPVNKNALIMPLDILLKNHDFHKIDMRKILTLFYCYENNYGACHNYIMHNNFARI